MKMDLKNFWYVIAESHELLQDKPLGVELFQEHYVLYRGKEGKPTLLPDRCLHRGGLLSKGRVLDGVLQCPYHGWKYGEQGKVVAVPSEGCRQLNLCHTAYPTLEQDGYIYLLLEPHAETPAAFVMPHYQVKGWKNIRLQHHFDNTVPNCVENFIDVPHTTTVHSGIFRKTEGRPMRAQVARQKGQVTIDYLDESTNLGSMSWFLNPSKGPVVHIDHYFMPNITHVIYRLPSGWEYLITSQSIPINGTRTLVYTDITYHFGLWTQLASWIVKHKAQKVIKQDIEVLKDQQTVLARGATPFINMPCDFMHVLISEIYAALENGIDPKMLPEKKREVTFYV